MDYKVIIMCTTFNHVKYIEDAMKGFIRQKTNFPYCALLIDDCSTDGNQEVIRRFEKEYPDIIKGVYLPHNMWYQPEEKDKYLRPWIERTEYLAYCEGDDYWISDYKLQIQVDFLDAHPDYLLHFHNAVTRYQDKDLPDYLLSNFKSGDFNIGRIFKKWQLPLASVVLRKEVLDIPLLQDLYKIFINSGFALFITAASKGKVYGQSECLSVYRRNDGGMSNDMSDAYCIQIDLRMALVSKDKEAIRFMKRWVIRQYAILMPRLIIGKPYAREFHQKISEYDHSLFFYGLLATPIIFPYHAIKRLLNILFPND